LIINILYYKHAAKNKSAKVVATETKFSTMEH